MRSQYGQRVLITGVSGGIGSAVAQLLASEGFSVVGCSRKAPTDPPPYAWVEMDVTSEDSVQRGVEQALAHLGGIDILVHCAGMGIGGAVEEVSAGELLHQIDVNTLGFVRVAQQVLPLMRVQRRGLLLPIGSVAGFISIPFQSSYSASKFALEALVEALRLEIAPFGIRVCLVEPGDTKTNFTAARTLSDASLPCYHGQREGAIFKMEQDEQKGKDPTTVAQAVRKLIGKAHPPIRYVVGGSYKTIHMLFKFLPAKLKEAALKRIYLPSHPAPEVALQAKRKPLP